MTNNWVSATFGDVIEVMRNGINCKQNKSGNGDKISRIETIADGAFNLDRVGYAELSEKEKEKYRLSENDILFSHINSAIHVGKTAILDIDNEIYHGVNLMLLRPKALLFPHYLHYYSKFIFWNGYWRSICKQSVNQASVNQTDIKRVPINYPPLPEQKRIVAILDEAFEGIGRAAANAEKNLANARELFESYLNAVFTQKGEGWEVSPLADLLERITYGFTNPMPTSDKGPYMVTAKNVNEGRIMYEHTRRTTQVAFDTLLTDKSRPRIGDLLLTKDGTLGRLAVVDSDNICINQSVAVLRPNSNADPYYLKYLLSSPEYQRCMIQDAGGATIKHIYITRVDKMEVAFPPIQQQRQLVSRFDLHLNKVQDLERNCRQKLANINELKQAILEKAFSGELTAQPDQALKEAVA